MYKWIINDFINEYWILINDLFYIVVLEYFMQACKEVVSRQMFDYWQNYHLNCPFRKPIIPKQQAL